MACCSGYSCIIGGGPSKAAVSNTSYGKQSHVFFKTGVSSSSFGLPLKIKRINLKDKSVFCSCKSTYTGTAVAEQQTCPLSSSNSIQVIGPNYCRQYPVDLAMVKKNTKLIYSNYVVSHQVDKTTSFYVTRDSSSFHQDFVLRDYADNEPLVTIRNKIFTTQERWQVYRGHNTDDKYLLFSVKKSSMKLSNKVAFDIYLSYNIIEDVCDFKIAENWLSKKTCDVYMGDNIIAQIQKKDVLGNRLFENDKLMLNVYPYVDYAFIVALSVIANEMDCFEDRKTLPSILAYHLFQHPFKFMARLLGVTFQHPLKFTVLLLGGVCFVSPKFFAGLIRMVMAIISDNKFLAKIKCMVMSFISGTNIAYLFEIVIFTFFASLFVVCVIFLWCILVKKIAEIFEKLFKVKFFT